MSAQEMIGQSKAFQGAMHQAQEAAIHNSSVCLLGESGTGKELFARYIHAESSRASHPFQTLNCGAISKELVGSELFGHEKGAFTGAIKARKGVFERAGNGTVFLDEIGTLPMELQPQFLRVLEERKVTRVGGENEIDLNFGLVSATNESLKTQVENGRFRRDLFYRISVIVIKVPPLRERDGDISLLANHYRKRQGKKELSSETWAPLYGYNWPGNVRELRSFVEHLNCAYAEIALNSNIVAEALERFMVDMPKAMVSKDTGRDQPGPFESFDAYMARLSMQADDFGLAACSIARYLLGMEPGKRTEFLGERCAISEDAFVVRLLADAVSLSCLVLAEDGIGAPRDIAAREFGLNRMGRKSVSELAAIERAVYHRLRNIDI